MGFCILSSLCEFELLCIYLVGQVYQFISIQLCMVDLLHNNFQRHMHIFYVIYCAKMFRFFIYKKKAKITL